MKELKLILDGLDCAHCGSKIEERAGKINNVSKSSLNFINKTLTVDYDDIEEISLFADIKSIVNKLEPDVKVSISKDIMYNDDCHTNEHDTGGACCCSEHDHHTEHQHTTISETHDHSHAHEDSGNKNNLIKLVTGAVIFGASLFLESNKAISISLALAAYVLVGYDILLRAFKNILRGQIFDENFLMSIASIGAIAIGEYPEAAGVMLFYKTGEYFQSLAVSKSRKQIKDLLNIKPEFANLKTKSGLIVTMPEKIQKGDIIVVKPGEKIPLDGIVIDGTSSVDTSALTGEAMPVDVEIHSQVLSGSINQTGVLTVEVLKPYKESTVSKILYLVEKAGNKKSQTENFITKFAKYYTPAVVFLAAFIAIVPPLVISGASFEDWIYKGLVFLVISCPCALVLSIPLTYFSGLGSASKNGILIKGANYLEALSDVEIAVFDKTGTLTEGKFIIAEINSFNDYDKDEVLKLSAYCEYYSNHIVADCVKNEYKSSIDETLIKDYKEISGHGITAVINGKKTALGNLKLMKLQDVDLSSLDPKQGTVLYLSVENTLAGYIYIVDKVKDGSSDLVHNLKSLGIKSVVMLTGDNSTVAEYVKSKVGLDNVYSDLLPQDKVEQVEKLLEEKNKKGKLIFVGDGINDAPVLMRADIGFAMGGVGSDAAIESADVVIMNDELEKVTASIKIAKKTKIIVWQNIIFALGIKLVVMFLDIFGTVSMPLAVFADVGVALLAVLNAARILKIKF